MDRALLLFALLLAPLAPTAAADGPDDIQECVGSGHWSTLVSRHADCTGQCIGSGHWTALPDRVVTCLT